MKLNEENEALNKSIFDHGTKWKSQKGLAKNTAKQYQHELDQ